MLTEIVLIGLMVIAIGLWVGIFIWLLKRVGKPIRKTAYVFKVGNKEIVIQERRKGGARSRHTRRRKRKAFLAAKRGKKTKAVLENIQQ